MSSKGGGESSAQAGFLGVLRALALIAVFAGAAGSLVLMFRTGRRNPSAVLLALFTVWVLSPFAALVAACELSRRWPERVRAALFGAMLIVAFASLAIYGAVVFGPPRPKPAFAFLVVPPASWAFAAAFVAAAAAMSRGGGGR